MMHRPRPGWLAASVLLASLYLLPLYVPPATSSGTDSSWLSQLFPGVPASWILARLGVLAAAALSFALALRGSGPRQSHPDTGQRCAPDPVRPALVSIAIATAATLTAVSFAAEALGRFGQCAFVLALPLPTLLVHLAYRNDRLRRPEPAAIACWAFAVTWAIARGIAADGDARAATPVDTWLNFEAFRAALGDGRNLLTERFEPGASDLAHLLMGAPFIQFESSTTLFAWLRSVSLAWIVATAILVRSLARRLAGGPASLVATTILLASPAILWLPLTPAPLALATVIVAALFLAFY